MLIEHISVSRKQTFKECPKRYSYKYHLKIPDEQPEQMFFTYGKVIHRIAELYVEGKGKKQIGKIAEDVLKGKVPLERYSKKGTPIALPTNYRNRMPEHLRNVVRFSKDLGWAGELEMGFNHDLDPPNKKYVKGFIDRVVPKGDLWYIIDYKTSQKNNFRKNRLTITNDLQLRCYASVVQKKFDVPADKIRAALLYLEGGDLVGAQFSQQSLDAAEKELLDAYNQIKAADADQVQGYVGDHCRYCPYRKICPFWSLTGSGT